MLTAGVDLAAQPSKTAVAVIDWATAPARVLRVVLGAEDQEIIRTANWAAWCGIDCPLGWPEQFVSFVSAQREGAFVAPEILDVEWRRTLAYRQTDEHVRSRTGIVPLSVAADRIALTAMRAAGLLAKFAAGGSPVDRTGGGGVVEVYPAASLRQWGLPHRGYKGADRRLLLTELVGRFLSKVPLDLQAADRRLCEQSDDAFDAVIAAVTARAAALGLSERPPDHLRDVVRREGWIELPLGGLTDLVR